MVGGAVDGDIFTGLSAGPVHAATALPPARDTRSAAQLRWAVGGLPPVLASARALRPGVDRHYRRLARSMGRTPFAFRLQIANTGTAPLTVTLKATLPAGWQGETPTTVTVPAGTSVEVASKVTAEKGTPNGTVTFTYEASAPGQSAVSLSVPVVFERGEGGQ